MHSMHAYNCTVGCTSNSGKQPFMSTVQVTPTRSVQSTTRPAVTSSHVLNTRSTPPRQRRTTVSFFKFSKHCDNQNWVHANDINLLGIFRQSSERQHGHVDTCDLQQWNVYNGFLFSSLCLTSLCHWTDDLELICASAELNSCGR